MPIICKDSSGELKEFERPKTGLVNAVCCAVYDLKLQKVVFKGEEKVQHQVFIQFEIDQLMKEGELSGKRFRIGRTFTNSLNSKSTLRKQLNTWGIKITEDQEKNGFDLETLVGKGATVLISEAVSKSNGNTYSNLAGINPPMGEAWTVEPIETPEWVQDKVEAAV
jgi:hypothetical protein